MIITPLRDYVLLEELKDTLPDIGIVLASDAEVEKPDLARVLSLGSHIANLTTDSTGPMPQNVSNGDIVLFKRHLFDQVTLDKKSYLLGKIDGLTAIVQAFDPEPEENDQDTNG